jgi:ferredoxin--NADP+ reductase
VHEDVDRRLHINPDECIDCGACVDSCPVEAIHPEDDVPASSRLWVEINHLYFKDRAAARARVEELAPAVLAARAEGG